MEDCDAVESISPVKAEINGGKIVILENISLASSDGGVFSKPSISGVKRKTDCKIAPVVPVTAQTEDVIDQKDIKTDDVIKSKRVRLFKKHTGPEWHKVTNKLVTPPILVNNLSRAFEKFPIFGRPKSIAHLDSFQDQALREFVGLPDDEFEQLSQYCSTDNLLTGKEMQMASLRPIQGPLSAAMALREEESIIGIPEDTKLNTLKKLRARIKSDLGNIFPRKLKYRGVRLINAQTQTQDDQKEEQNAGPPDLEPGKDVLFRVRFYRPFSFALSSGRKPEGHPVRGRHSMFDMDVVVSGRQPLTALRDRVVCRNDLDIRMDMSRRPDLVPPASSKDSFPSNFMFINNVFYVDTRANCKDLSVVVREFALARGLGSFPARDMCRVTLGELTPRLAHPEVYVHQGNCEHIFQFSEIRLLNTWDPPRLSRYPLSSVVSHNQTLYCNTCAEFSARWIVTESQRVPFDPAFFCDTCFHSYMYKNGKKVEDFRAYLYKGNEINTLKPNTD